MKSKVLVFKSEAVSKLQNLTAENRKVKTLRIAEGNISEIILCVTLRILCGTLR
jgi:hypothetical protein